MRDFMDDINNPASSPEPVQEQQTQNFENRYDGQYNYGGNYNAQQNSSKTENTYKLPSVAVGERSIMTDILKASLGAIVGALPGMLLWIIIGKIGYTASICGLLLAAGIVFGYTFMTKDDAIPLSWGVVICLVIMIASVYFAERIVWTWAMVDAFKDFIPKVKESTYTYTEQFGYEDFVINDDYIKSYTKSLFGFSEGTFSNCWSNFKKVVEVTGSESEYHQSLLQSYAFAALGGGSLFYKFARNK